MLVASQVLLSIILPTVIFPLVLLCSKDDVMSVEGPDLSSAPATQATEQNGDHLTSRAQESPRIEMDMDPVERETPVQMGNARRVKSYKSPMWMTVLGYLLFAIVVIANAYVIVQLILGNA